MLELGVFRGGSLLTWSEYFPKSQIIGVDIDKNCAQYAGENREVIIANLGDVDVLKDLMKYKPTIIIDDASHRWSHQLKALFILFEVLPSGGVFILEDIETSFPRHRFTGYDDAAVSAYDVVSAIAEIVTECGFLREPNKPKALLDAAPVIERLAMQIEIISFINGSCIMIKR